jgi:hypothetical protein
VEEAAEDEAMHQKCTIMALQGITSNMSTMDLQEEVDSTMKITTAMLSLLITII